VDRVRGKVVFGSTQALWKLRQEYLKLKASLGYIPGPYPEKKCEGRLDTVARTCNHSYLRGKDA
jgi:hypothetical protein